MATPLIQSKVGQVLVFYGPVTNTLTGAVVTSPEADDWENDQSYLKSELAKITANSTDYTLRCIEAYTSSSSATLTGSVAAGVLTLSGTDASRWEPVAGPGAMFRGTAFTWSESRTTTEEDFIEDSGTQTSVSGVPLTGSYTFVFDRANEWHHIVSNAENEFNFRIFADGAVAGGRYRQGRCQIDPSDEKITNRANVTLAFASQGNVVRRKVTANDIIGIA